MEYMDLKVSEENLQYIPLVENNPDLCDGEPYPPSFYEPLRSLWEDLNVQKAWERGNEAALPEKYIRYLNCEILKFQRCAAYPIISLPWTGFSALNINLQNRMSSTAVRGPLASQR